MFAARFGGVDATSGTSFEFMVVTAVVIGGVNVFGGSGSVLGAMLGALLVAVIDNGFTLLRFSEFWKIFFEGAAIVVAVTVDALLNKRLQELLRTTTAARADVARRARGERHERAARGSPHDGALGVAARPPDRRGRASGAGRSRATSWCGRTCSTWRRRTSTSG